MTAGSLRSLTTHLPPLTQVRLQLPDGRIVEFAEAAIEWEPVPGNAKRWPTRLLLVAEPTRGTINANGNTNGQPAAADR